MADRERNLGKYIIPSKDMSLVVEDLNLILNELATEIKKVTFQSN